MSQDPSIPSEKDSQLIRQVPESARLPVENLPALTEITGRAFAHIQTSKSLGMLHRIGQHELYGPDYRLVCAWAEEIRLTPDGLLNLLLQEVKSSGPIEWQTKLVDGRFRDLRVDDKLPGISGPPLIEGLVIRRLSLIKARLSSLYLSGFPNLAFLDCSQNQLTELDLSGVPHLEHLDCSGNLLLTGLEHTMDPSQKLLTVLMGDFKGLAKLNLSGVPNLTFLKCSSNQLTELNLSEVPNLGYLDCSGNRLTQLNLAEIPDLGALDCSINELIELDLSGVPDLGFLNFSLNRLTDVNLSKVQYLYALYCFYNQLSNLDLSEVPKLERLDCSGNRLNSLDIRSVLNLRKLSYDQDTCSLLQRSDQNFE